MTTHAYAEEYLDAAMNCLGDAFDYAVNICKVSLGEFYDAFTTSGFAQQFENGTPRIVLGLSGAELVREIFNKIDGTIETPVLEAPLDKSPEYWTGWILAYMQWKTSIPFEEITEYLPVENLRALYPTLHEAPEDKAVDVFASIYQARKTPTKLYKFRKIKNYSQAKLAEKSGISLRSLQMYEQRRKNINKASFESIYALSRALNVRPENLYEYELTPLVSYQLSSD